MVTKYSANISNKVIKKNLHRIIGQIYKLLPYREEGIDWKKPLVTIQIELAGMDSLFKNYEDFHKILFSLECKLEGLFLNAEDKDFERFRGIIFECIGKVKDLQDLCQD